MRAGFGCVERLIGGASSTCLVIEVCEEDEEDEDDEDEEEEEAAKVSRPHCTQRP